MDDRVAGGRRGSFLAAGVCPSEALRSPAGAHVSGEPVDWRTRLDTGRRSGGGSWVSGRPWVFRAVAGAQGGVSAPGLLLDFRGPGTEARRAGMPQPAA